MRPMFFVLLIALALCSGCDEQRDLYDVTSPYLSVEGDWVPSLNIADMSQHATAMVYNGKGYTKEYFYKPNVVTTKVSKGTYDILLFNGMMFTEENTNLNAIYFKETNSVETFEAFVAAGEANKRLSRSEDEFIASNEMEILTSRRATVEVIGTNQYYLKYQDGKNGFPDIPNYIEEQIKLVPKPVSYYAQIVVNLINPSSAFAANGALRGFVGSVNMATRMPSHTNVTHHLKLNNMKITQQAGIGVPELGTIESPLFVTFGPPVDLSERKYEFELKIVLTDGEEVHRFFDITEQVVPVIEKVKENLNDEIDVPVKLTVPIDITVELPVVDPGKGSGIDIGDWGEDEIIKIPIKTK